MSLSVESRRVTLAIAAVMFMLVLDSTILNTSLPAIAAAQDVPPLSLSSVVTGYLLAAAALLPISAWLGERYGMRRVFLSGVFLFTAASPLCAIAQSPTQLVIARVLQGTGGALLLPLGRTIALRGARKDEVIGITALLTWPALFGPVLGPPLGGFLSTYASWRWNFLLNVPIGVVAMALLARWVRARRYPRSRCRSPVQWAWPSALWCWRCRRTRPDELTWPCRTSTRHSWCWPCSMCWRLFRSGACMLRLVPRSCSSVPAETVEAAMCLLPASAIDVVRAGGRLLPERGMFHLIAMEAMVLRRR